jgi:nuclear transport factor 2 (NTF2) superfamily protein
MKQEQKLPLPPFNEQSAKQKVRMAENGWNLKNSKNISMAYSPNSKWRNRDIFLNGRDEIIEFLDNKFNKELNYKLCKELWSFTNNKIAVRFAYEWHDKNDQWYRSYGNENWEFDENGLMKIRFASINDLKIDEADRKLLWEEDIRPENYKSLSQMGL